MNGAVVAVFHKVWMGVERVVFAVLEYEYAAVLRDRLIELRGQ